MPGLTPRSLASSAELDSDGDDESTGSLEVDEDTEESTAYERLHELEYLKRKFEDATVLAGPQWAALAELKVRWSMFEAKLYGRRCDKDPEGLFRMMRALGPEACRLMRALSVQINDVEMLKGRKIQWSTHRRRALIRFGRLVPEDWCDLQGTCSPKSTRLKLIGCPLEAVAPKYDKRKFMDRRGKMTSLLVQSLTCPNYKKVRVDVHWSGMHVTKNMEGFLKLCNCMCEVSEVCNVFDTPIGSVLVQLAKKNATRGIYRDRLADLICIIVMYILGRYSRQCEKNAAGIGVPGDLPEKTPLWPCLCIVNVFRISSMTVELWMCHRVFGTLRPRMTAYVVLNWAMELFIAHICFQVLFGSRCDGSSQKGKYLCAHPLKFSFVTFLKWVQVVEKFITMDIFVDAVLPALYAIISPESCTFILLILLLNWGSVLAYLCLPAAVWGKLEDSLFSHFEWATIRMLQMNFLGDVNEDVLGGYSETVRPDGSIVTTGQVYEVQGHMPTLMTVMCFLFSVIFLNLYVGILSNSYNRLVENLVELKGQHTIVTTLPHLLSMYCFSRCNILFPLTRDEIVVEDLPGPPESYAPSGRAGGFWFSLAEARRPSHES